MEIKDFCEAGGDIMNAVADAINRNDYSELGSQIANTVNQVARQVKQDTSTMNQNRYQNYQYKSTPPDYRNYNQRGTNSNAAFTKMTPALYVKNPPGAIAGPLKLAGGITLLSGFGIAAFVMLLLSMIIGKGVFIVLTVFFGAFTAGGAVLTSSGAKMIKQIKHFKEYVRIIGTRSYISIEELVAQSGRNKETVIGELQKMISSRMFLQGKMDQKQTTLMLTDEAYQQYLTSVEEYEKRRQQEASLKQSVPDGAAQSIILEGNEYIKTIHECNEKIPDQEMSVKLYKLEEIIRKIFAQVEKHPENAESLRKFMSYYLPTTKKLLFAYIDLDNQPISGENIQKTKREIADSLDTINQAYENLLDDLFEDTAWDISSDISAMKTMMAQEGLTGQADFVNKK